MKRTTKSLCTYLLSGAIALLAGCGGGGGGGTITPQTSTLTGVFLDSAVGGISYRTETQSGVTNAKGEFQYKAGETVTFSIGKIDLPSAVAGPTITPLTLAGSSDLNNQKVSNILVLLQTLDQDGNPSNGITIPAAAATLATSAVSFDVSPDVFANNATIRAMVAGAGSTNTSLIPAQTAKANFNATVTTLGVNVQPEANAGSTQSVLTGATVTLDGSKSSDANGDPLTYSWSFTTPVGSTAKLSSSTAVKPTFVADVAGDYVATLVVNDGKLNSSAYAVLVTASVGNAPPVANAGSAQSVTIGNTVTLDGSASSDVNGDTLTYLWSLTSKPSGSSATLTSTTLVKPTFTPDVAGTYIASLVVNDGKVNSDASTVQISAVNPPVPTVTLTSSSQSPYQGDSVTLTWSSTNATACTASGAWTGSLATSGSQSVTVASLGTNSYTLTCTKGTQSASAQVQVTSTVKPYFVEIPNAFSDMTGVLNFPDSAMPTTQGQILSAVAVDLIGNGKQQLVLSVGKMRGSGIQTLPDRSRIFIFQYNSVNQFIDITSNIIKSDPSFDGVSINLTVADVNGDGKPDIIILANEDDGRTRAGSLVGAYHQALISDVDGRYVMRSFGNVGTDYYSASIGYTSTGAMFINIIGDKSYSFSGIAPSLISLNIPNLNYATGFMRINGSVETNGIITGSQYPYAFGRKAYLGNFQNGWSPAGEIQVPYPIVSIEQFQTGTQITTSHVYNFNGIYLSGELNGNAMSDSCVINISPNSPPSVLFTMATSSIPNYTPGQLIDSSTLVAFTKIIGGAIANGALIDATPSIIGEQYIDVNLRNMVCTDVNNDGYTDIVLQRLATQTGDVSPIIYINNKQGGFIRSNYYNNTSIKSANASSWLEGAIVGDFDGDGTQDIAIFPSISNDISQLGGTFKFFKGLQSIAY